MTPVPRLTQRPRATVLLLIALAAALCTLFGDVSETLASRSDGVGGYQTKIEEDLGDGLFANDGPAVNGGDTSGHVAAEAKNLRSLESRDWQVVTIRAFIHWLVFLAMK